MMMMKMQRTISERWLLFARLSGRGQHRAVDDSRVLSNFGFLIDLEPINVTGTKATWK